MIEFYVHPSLLGHARDIELQRLALHLEGLQARGFNLEIARGVPVVWGAVVGGWRYKDFYSALDSGRRFRLPFDLDKELAELLAFKESLDHE